MCAPISDAKPLLRTIHNPGVIPDLPLRSVFDLDLSAASGLVVLDGLAWVVADHQLALHGYPLDGAGRPCSIALDPAMAVAGFALPKKIKPDLEVLFDAGDGRLVALGSGSRPNRCRGFSIDYAGGTVDTIDLWPSYESPRLRSAPLNVEGAVRLGDALILAHRGLSAADPSRILVFDAQACLVAHRDRWPASALRSIITVDLGTLDGVPPGVTDLALHPRLGLHYLAVAERTEDAYADGEVVGTVFGRLDAEFRPTTLGRLRPDHKCEGLAWWKADAAAEHWLGVTDADDPTRPARLLSFALPV